MAKIIAELWNGNVEPLQYFGRNNAEMKQLEQLVWRHQEALEGSVDEKTQRLFKKYSDCFNEYLCVACEQAFCDGYSLGTKITAEALCEET